jgi:hypothetical protein
MSEHSTDKPKRPGCSCSASGDVKGCYHHDPARQAARKRNATKAAKAKGNKEVAIIKEEIKTAIAEVRTGELDRNKARVMFSGWSALLDYIRLERQVYVEDDLAVRIEELKRERPDAS